MVLEGPQFGAGFVNDEVDKSDRARDGRSRLIEESGRP
jgi:hypothetical protein